MIAIYAHTDCYTVSHAAFCRRNGVWKGSSWNGDLLNMIAPDIEEIYHDLQEEVQARMSQLSEELNTLIPGIKRDLEGMRVASFPGFTYTYKAIGCKKLNDTDIAEYCSFLEDLQSMLSPQIKDLASDMIKAIE